MISFAHGLGDGGEDIHYYDDALHDLASHGYIIIGSQAAGNLYCHDEYKDQLRNIEWAQSDETYSKMINWDIQVGLLGHSMGGESTHRAAGDVEGVKKYNIGAAVAFSPVFYKLQILVPFMFGTGSNDHIVKPMDVEVAYD
jgi:dienelactone hydrolase